MPEPEGPGRHALIAIGGSATLHVFELAKTPPPDPGPIFDRGRVDHFALHVADEETFEGLRADLMARGSTDGTVTDFGITRVLAFTDPDGHYVELALWVGGADPAHVDASRASDDELIARRAATAGPDDEREVPRDP